MKPLHGLGVWCKGLVVWQGVNQRQAGYNGCILSILLQFVTQTRLELSQ